jgi:hypothetical protein
MRTYPPPCIAFLIDICLSHHAPPAMSPEGVILKQSHTTIPLVIDISLSRTSKIIEQFEWVRIRALSVSKQGQMWLEYAKDIPQDLL